MAPAPDATSTAPTLPAWLTLPPFGAVVLAAHDDPPPAPPADPPADPLPGLEGDPAPAGDPADPPADPAPRLIDSPPPSDPQAGPPVPGTRVATPRGGAVASPRFFPDPGWREGVVDGALEGYGKRCVGSGRVPGEVVVGRLKWMWESWEGGHEGRRGREDE